ncbi:uncharacterized protein G2W53_020471 [Senna tora]|uniref:Uncharacterized protein n=1 Tax=Senna tora TaxID=362788 RepID=A0A834TWI2_9FABA|nr:uncharacterized protein G2W53_020471 [Senna tora]
MKNATSVRHMSFMKNNEELASIKM